MSLGQGLSNSHTVEHSPPALVLTSISGGSGWEGQKARSGQTQRRQAVAGASSKGTSLQPQLQGVAGVNPMLSEKREGVQGREGRREGLGYGRVGPDTIDTF